MVNLSKCKFGDRFKTKGGRMAIFLHKSFVCHEVYICAIERDKYSHLEMKYLSDGKRYFDNEPSEYDIKGKWEDEPDEPKEENIKGIEWPSYLTKVYKLN